MIVDRLTQSHLLSLEGERGESFREVCSREL